MLAFGNLTIGATLVLLNTISILGAAFTLQLLSVVVLLFIVASGCMLSISSLFTVQAFARYFGFIQFPLGTGCMLVLVGVLNLGLGGMISTVVGSLTISWGVINILFHGWLKKAAVHVPLMRQGAGLPT